MLNSNFDCRLSLELRGDHTVWTIGYSVFYECPLKSFFISSDKFQKVSAHGCQISAFTDNLAKSLMTESIASLADENCH